MYQKSIIILQDKRFAQHIKVLLHKKKKGVLSTYPLLTDIDSIRNELFITKNTSNIRVSLGQFIKEHGFPYLFIMDYMIDFGLKEEEDPDKRKLLRTVLIAFTVLANAKGYSNALANIVLVAGKKKSPIVSVYIKNPSILLKQLHTNDERVNSFIKSFLTHNEKLINFFNLSSLVQPEEGHYANALQQLEKITDDIDKKIASKKKPQTPGTTTEMITDDLDPADVICRATMEKIFVNGEMRTISEGEKNRYREKNISLEGALTVKTITAVKERLLTLFQAMSKINPFKKDERIFIHVPDSSLIDGSFASSMGTFLSSALPEYKGISLDVGAENSKKLRKSNGYFAVKDFIIKNL